MFAMNKNTLIIIVMIFHNTLCLKYRGASCSQMFNRAYEGYIPKGNERAGTYVLIEDVTNLEDCITKCCENETCNAALIFNQNCFVLDCYSNSVCVPILHHNTNIRENVTMVLVKPRKRNESWENILNYQDAELKNWKGNCPKLHEFTYRGFLPKGKLSAGNYSFIEGITDLKKCILRCCNDDNCNVAVLMDFKCYNIECKSSKLCIPALYPNTSMGKSFSMVLVKPVDRMEKWKNILQTFNESGNEGSSEDILPEIYNGETTMSSTESRAINITLKLPIQTSTKRNESEKSFKFSWTQIEGPTELEISENNKTEFEIGNFTIGNYTIKLGVKNLGSFLNHSNSKSTVNVTEKEPATTVNGNQNEEKSKL